MPRRSDETMKGKTQHINSVELPNEFFLKEVRTLIADGRDVTLRVRGVSMRPFLEDRRDKIVLTRLEKAKVGDAVLAEIAPGKYVYHRIVRIDGNRVTLRGDGNVYGTEQCELKDIAAATKELIRKERHYSPEGMAWRWYSALWPSNVLMRRVLLAVHRRLPKKWR